MSQYIQSYQPLWNPWCCSFASLTSNTSPSSIFKGFCSLRLPILPCFRQMLAFFQHHFNGGDVSITYSLTTLESLTLMVCCSFASLTNTMPSLFLKGLMLILFANVALFLLVSDKCLAFFQHHSNGGDVSIYI